MLEGLGTAVSVVEWSEQVEQQCGPKSRVGSWDVGRIMGGRGVALT